VFKKAQAAMEFLMTYGWAILVVLAAIGALAYFGVLSPSNLLPTKCEFPAGLDCTEHPSADAAADTIVFPVINSLGYEITVTGANSTGTGTCTGAGSASPSTVPNGNASVITLGTCTGLESGERYKDTVSVVYTSAKTGMSHVAVGVVAGKAR